MLVCSCREEQTQTTKTKTMKKSNLIPIKPGEKLALKRPEDRKTERIPIQVTKAHKAELVTNSKKAKMTLSAYLLEGKIINTPENSLERWILEAAPMLSRAACIVADEAIDRLGEIAGVQAVLETCPIDFMESNASIGGETE